MTAFLISFSMALVLASLFTFRFRMWRRPGVITAYLFFFLALEWTLETLWLEPGTLGIEIAYVCFAITGLLVVAMVLADRWDASATCDE